MELTKEMAKVVAEIEYLIGSECYNPNSYDGWNDIEGRDFRYPVNLPDAKETLNNPAISSQIYL